MLLEKNFRVPVRMSIEHADPVLYARLEPGDQIVLYIDGVRNGVSDLRNYSTEARAMTNMLALRELTFELVDVSTTRVVWEVLRAERFENERAAE